MVYVYVIGWCTDLATTPPDMLHQRHSEDMFRLGKSEHESRRGGGPHLPFAANGCSLTWSNGMVEGFVNKVKWIKRSSYGQAGFPLLQRRVLLHSPLQSAWSRKRREPLRFSL